MRTDRRWLPFLLGGLALAALVNVGWITDALLKNRTTSSSWIDALISPNAAIVGNSIAIVLILWGSFALFARKNPDRALARKLHRRGDHRGAAQLFLKAGNTSKALKLFKVAGDWEGAADAATRLGQYRTAADCLRSAGGRHLTEAARLYHRAGDTEAARLCSRETGTWLENQGRFDEAID
ncbi:MAG: hypothetical protein ABFS37_13440, partial [Acidobacteriota bacterium]